MSDLHIDPNLFRRRREGRILVLLFPRRETSPWIGSDDDDGEWRR